jgi:replicative DNA helicase
MTMQELRDTELEKIMAAYAFAEGGATTWIEECFSHESCRKIVRYCKKHGAQTLSKSTGSVIGITQDEAYDILMRPYPASQLAAASSYHRLRDLMMRRKQAEYHTKQLQEVRDFSKELAPLDKPWHTLDDRLTAFKRSIETRGHGMIFGWPFVDDFLGGLGTAKVFTVAAASGVGKTAMVMNILQRALVHQPTLHALFFCFEMDVEQHTKREMEIALQVDPRHTFGVMRDDVQRQEYANKSNPLSRLLVDYKARSLEQMAQSVRMAKEEFGACNLVGVDYLQYIQREKHVSINELTEQLKQFAKELDVALILLVQLDKTAARTDRQTGKPQRPNGFDALGGVGIQSNSDFVLSMWREQENLFAQFTKARTMHNVALRDVVYRLEMDGLTIHNFIPSEQAEQE